MEFRFLTEKDRESVKLLHNLVHMDLAKRGEQELFLPYISGDYWHFDVEDCVGSFEENQLTGMCGSVMQGEDLRKYADMLNVKWKDLGEVFACVHPDHRLKHIATELAQIGVKHVSEQKKRHVCATAHPLKKNVILERLGFEPKCGIFAARNNYPRILLQKDFYSID